jgi:homopolymeric O-antigen transport system ATP-binding protein
MYGVLFDRVSKRYPRGGPRYASLRNDLAGTGRRVGELFRRRPGLRGTLAIQDVSFEVQQGESFAIIGPNGAGKTTLLKLASRISLPTSGRICVRGRLGALIEVGSGIHPELTATENIWLYGQILGMSRNDIKRRFDEIVEFAELGGALETPVKMYSSGMQLRLGFSIAAHLDPEVFVVDEALAVGDAGFQAKCVERMTKLVAEGRTVLFVSHNLSAVEAICDRAIFLLDGEVRAEGSVKEILRKYLSWVEQSDRRMSLGPQQVSSKYLGLDRASCHAASGEERYRFSTGDDLEVRLRFRALAPLNSPYVSIGITDGRPGNLVLCSMLLDGSPPSEVDGAFAVSCRLHSIPLLPRVYQLWCSVRSEAGFGDLFDWQQVGAFRVAAGPNFSGPSAEAYVSTDAPVHVGHEWQVKRADNQ